MASSTRLRTTSAWFATALVAALVPLLGPATPAFAAECTSEQAPEPTFPPTLPPDYGCDDVNPPDTRIASMSPAPNEAGWTKTSSVTFGFSEVVDDADQGPWTFQCKLDDPLTTGTADEEFAPCTSPTTYDDLGDRDQAYTFSVYAVDDGDSGTFVGNPFDSSDDEDPAQPDDDSASPATRTWKQDTALPIARIFPAENGSPYDEEGTGWPIAEKPSVTYLLESLEDGVEFRCQLTGVRVPCSEGENTFTGIGGGDQVLSLSLTDPAGNESESPVIEQFVMPYNLTQGKNWSRRSGRGYFARDFLQTRTTGARIKFRATNIRALRVIAPAGPTLGKIRVRTGTGFWKTFNLAKGKRTKSRHLVVRSAQAALFSGPILIESLSRGKPVRVDALVFPHS